MPEGNFDNAVNIRGDVPALNLIDTILPGTKSLKIDVNNNIAQIRELAGAANSLLSFDLANNQITAFAPPANWLTTAKFMIAKDPVDASEPSLLFVLPIIKTNTQASNFYRTAGCGVDIFGAITIGKIVGFEATCAIATAGGTATFANAINAFCTALLNTQITHSHVVNIPPSNVPDNIPPNPPIPKINTIPNSIAVRIAKQFEVTPPRTRDYGIYYGAHAEGSEPAGTFAIYAAEDNCFFGGNVGIGQSPGNDKLTVRKVGQSQFYAISLLEGSNSVGINPNAFTGAANPLVQAGDKSIIFSNGATNTGNLVIGPWTSANSGIRMTNTGLIGVGTATPTASLHIKAGTATVAPLKLTAGTNLTTPQAGTFEYNGTNLYFTKGDGIRRVIQMI